MATSQRLSQAAARRICLAAQGFCDPAPRGPVTARHVRRALSRTHLLQIDSVNVFERAHHMPLYSRLGPYDTALLADLAYRRRELFEYWGHEASLLPVSLHPLMRWRMERAAAYEEGWGGVLRFARDNPELIARVKRRLADEGPMGAAAMRERPRSKGSWWSWDQAKVALEFLFWTGEVTTHSRPSFERIYDLTDRVLPPEVLAMPTPTREDAQRQLVLLAARALGVATEADLRDYFRLRAGEAREAVRDLVEDGSLLEVAVDGWRQPAFLHPKSRRPRSVSAGALLSPFDPLVWRRERAQRVFGFDYRIEIYVPAPKRRFGYYVLPFLLGDQVVARVDLKSDRRAGVLRVLASWLEPGQVADRVAVALTAELRRAAAWQGLPHLAIEARGDLAPALRASSVGQSE